MNNNTTTTAVATIVAAAVVLLAQACSTDRVDVSGHLLNLNQATLYAFATDGTITTLDTITVQGGRFQYHPDLKHEGTITLLMPNHTLLPLFVYPGDDIDIDGNAQQLSTVDIDGNKPNSDYTKLRQQQITPDIARQYIAQHPDSPLALWLVRRYITDTQQAIALLKQLTPTEPVRRALSALQLHALTPTAATIRPFRATALDGTVITERDIRRAAPVTVLLWATWDYNSTATLRSLASGNSSVHSVQSVAGGNSSVPSVQSVAGGNSAKRRDIITISLDPDTATALSTIRSCQAQHLVNICDTRMLDTPLLTTFGLATTGQQVVVK